MRPKAYESCPQCHTDPVPGEVRRVVLAPDESCPFPVGESRYGSSVMYAVRPHPSEHLHSSRARAVDALRLNNPQVTTVSFVIYHGSDPRVVAVADDPVQTGA